MDKIIDEAMTRIKVRMGDETYDESIMRSLAVTIYERIMIRLGIANSDAFPIVFVSVICDATIVMWRRRFFEGIKSENLNGYVSTQYVDDVLNAFEKDFDAWRAAHPSGTTAKVSFL